MIHNLKENREDRHARRFKKSAYVREALDLGCLDAKLIPVESIITGHWVRIKCQYGCPSFASVLTCPPYTPPVEDIWDLLGSYHQALLIRGENGEFIREMILRLEKRFMASGFHKAFGIGSGPCRLCSPCELENGCKFPEKARPSMAAFGIDVYKTLQNNGWRFFPSVPFNQHKDHFGLVLVD